MSKRAVKARRSGGQGVGQRGNDVITAPVAQTRVIRAQKPKVETVQGGGFRLTHRELVTTVVNSAAYQVNGGLSTQRYRLNPSFGSTLTWCPSIAANFDQYTFKRLELEYVPACGTDEKGRVGLWFDKDSEDEPPADRVELSNMGVMVDTAPWSVARLMIPTDNVKRFCLGTGTNTDAKLIDLGQIGYSTYNGGSTNVVGEVFASYTIELYYPQPAGASVQTLRKSSTGVNTVETGPLYFNMTKTATQIDLLFTTPGTFLISVGCGATAYTAELTLGSATLNSRTLTSSGSGFSGSFNLTTTKPGDGLRMTGTAFADCMVFATRARVANNVTV
uniref:Capsid protein n=1 Tax=Maize-associated tombusvirus TaxID=2201470 RepID=A0A2U9IZN3_9TOMB|nr:coat protein [Maize-associated tombusvirus]